MDAYDIFRKITRGAKFSKQFNPLPKNVCTVKISSITFVQKYIFRILKLKKKNPL